MKHLQVPEIPYLSCSLSSVQLCIWCFCLHSSIAWGQIATPPTGHLILCKLTFNIQSILHTNNNPTHWPPYIVWTNFSFSPELKHTDPIHHLILCKELKANIPSLLRVIWFSTLRAYCTQISSQPTLHFGLINLTFHQNWARV